MIKQQNKLINYDSIYATQNNLNSCYITYKTDPLQHVKKIQLKSLEIPICVENKVFCVISALRTVASHPRYELKPWTSIL